MDGRPNALNSGRNSPGCRGALTMGLASGYRNMAIMLVLTAGMAGPDMWLYVAIAQFPIFIMPMLTNPIYRRLLPAGTT